MIKAVILDVDGVIRNSKEAANRGYEAAFKIINLDFGFKSIDTWRLRGYRRFNARSKLISALYSVKKAGLDLSKLMEEKNFEQKILKLMKKFPLSKKRLLKMEKAFKESFRKEKIPLIIKTKEALEILKRKGLKIAIYTDSYSDITKEWLKENKIVDYFEVIIGREDVKKPKPNPEGILKICQKLNLSSNQCAYVGDSEIDLKLANKAGCQAISVLSGMGDKKLFKKENSSNIFDNLYIFAKNYF